MLATKIITRIVFLFVLAVFVSTIALVSLGQLATAAPPEDTSTEGRALQAAISAVKTASPAHEIKPGAVITYTIVFTLDHNSAMAVITDPVPLDLTVLGADNGTVQLPGGGTFYPPTGTQRIIVWEIPNITAHQPVTLSFTARVSDTPAGESIFNTAYISSEFTKTTAAANAVSIIGSPDNLLLHKTAAPPANTTVKPGDLITYTLRMTNPENQATVTVIDSFPPRTVYHAASAESGTVATSTSALSWTVHLLKNKSATATLVLQTLPDYQGPIIAITNSFYLDGATPRSNIITHTLVPTQFIFLPLTLKNYPPPLPAFKNADFELGPNGNWTEESSNFGSGSLIYQSSKLPDPVRAHNNSNYAAWLGGAAYETSTLWQTVEIPKGYPSLSLGYWYWIASKESNCANDTGYLKVLFDGSEQASFEHDLCGNTNEWKYIKRDISAYTGKIVTFKFIAILNGSVNSNFFIDDVYFVH